MEVLAGERASVVADRWGVDVALLHRWVQAFVEAGTAQVTNRPAPDVARQRDRFLSVFTHGLRSPLAVAQAWVGLLGDLSADEHARDQALLRLQAALDLLDERTGEVELLTAAMLGRVECHPVPTAVGELAASLAQPYEIGGDGAEVELCVDPELFVRVLRDLWRAAATTRPAPRSVRVETSRDERWDEVRVVRHGDPIAPETARALFEPFDAPDGETFGVTVGLYLARALTVVHGGTIGMDQDDDRAVLWVRIPHPDPGPGAHQNQQHQQHPEENHPPEETP
jgi:signal transduction histidine kinase